VSPELRLALAVREFGLKPYRRAWTDDCRELELISYPFPDGAGGLAILAREPGDPTTVQQYRLPDELRDLLGGE
jgi:hypothetical protein